jgi:hypothetical protein
LKVWKILEKFKTFVSTSTFIFSGTLGLGDFCGHLHNKYFWIVNQRGTYCIEKHIIHRGIRVPEITLKDKQGLSTFYGSTKYGSTEFINIDFLIKNKF